ncbi:MAG: hypothetical protein IJT23_08180 [Clostridia bacterium]|nr:hypothetical protein [Clostridia bacterium]
MANISIDFNDKIGKIKPMHGVGQPPFGAIDFSFVKYLKDANIPYSRLHDVGGWFGGNMFVDIPNIFRDFSADETDPSSYDFVFTDMLIEALEKNNCEPVYRLGVTIENFHYIKAYRIFPPKNMEKWARICEHIIRHYNEGWADGFHYGIKYWEIWNEPDNGIDNTQNMMWHGTKEEFYELYRVTSKHLRKCFGNTIKIGGYGHSGFYVVDSAKDIENSIGIGLGMKENPTDWEKRTEYFITFFDGFIDMVVKENLPFDFFSHHSYATVWATVKRQKYVEKRLNDAGLSEVEIHLNEWNPNARTKERGRSVASANAVAMMCAMQNTKMSMMCYYDARLGISMYGGLFNPMTYEPLCTYYGFKAFGNLYKLGTQVMAKSDTEDVYVLAGTDGEKCGVLISNIGQDTPITLATDKKLHGYLIDENNFYKETDIDTASFILKENQVIYLES